MKSQTRKLVIIPLTCLLIAVLLNLIIPQIVLPYVPQDITSKNSNKLTFKERFLLLMYQHVQDPVLTSIIIGVIVLVSVYLGNLIKL